MTVAAAQKNCDNRALPKVLVAHPGTQHAPRLAGELADRNLLYRYWTCFALAENGLFHRMACRLPAKARSLSAKRTIPRVTDHQLRTCPWLEIRTAIRRKFSQDSEGVFFERNRIFQERIPETELKRADAVIGFDTSSWVLAERSQRLGKPFVLDQSIAHPRTKERVFERIAKRYPEWSRGLRSKDSMWLSFEEREHRLATHISVASTFTKTSLAEEGVNQEKISVNPYGVDLELFAPPSERDRNRPLRFLFVGLVNARKGIPLLLEVWNRLQRRGAELWVVGSVEEHVRALIPDLPGLRILGRKSRTELASIFRDCDVFVFPSFFEGFGLVLLEALACGLPIIATDATAAPDLLRHPDEGTLIGAGDDEALEQAMQRFIDSPQQLEKMARAARKRAEECTWAAYGARWEETLREIATFRHP